MRLAMNKRTQLYEDITNKIMAKLQQGVLPWRKSWGKNGLPRNFISGKVYQGINYLNLVFDDYPSPYYLTYLQCKSLKGLVHKGSKSKSILFWKINEIENGDDVKSVPFLRLSHIFNLSQTSLYNKSESTPPTNISCEEIINNMPNKPVIKHNFQRCFYDPTEDYISTPIISDFESEAEFLVHYTMSAYIRHFILVDWDVAMIIQLIK